MKILKLFITIFLSLYMALSPYATYANDTPKDDEYTVGTITLSPPEKYLLIEDLKAQKKRLYKEEEYEKIKNKDLKVLQSVLIDTIEYRYKPVKEKVEFISKEFEVVELKDKKAILKKEYLEEPEKIIEEVEPVLEEEVEIEEEIKEPEVPEKEPPAKKLVAQLFFKIETKKVSNHEWEVSLPTIIEAAANFGEALGIVAKKIDELLKPQKTAKIFFNTSVGKWALGPNGLLIESLTPRLRDKCGIKDDDLIQMVNGKSLATIQDIAALFSTFSGSPQTVTVKLIRNEEDLTLTYYIK